MTGNHKVWVSSNLLKSQNQLVSSALVMCLLHTEQRHHYLRCSPWSSLLVKALEHASVLCWKALKRGGGTSILTRLGYCVSYWVTEAIDRSLGFQKIPSASSEQPSVASYHSFPVQMPTQLERKPQAFFGRLVEAHSCGRTWQCSLWPTKECKFQNFALSEET